MLHGSLITKPGRLSMAVGLLAFGDGLSRLRLRLPNLDFHGPSRCYKYWEACWLNLWMILIRVRVTPTKCITQAAGICKVKLATGSKNDKGTRTLMLSLLLFLIKNIISILIAIHRLWREVAKTCPKCFSPSRDGRSYEFTTDLTCYQPSGIKACRGCRLQNRT